MDYEFQKQYNAFNHQYDSCGYIKNGFNWFYRLLIFPFICLFIGFSFFMIFGCLFRFNGFEYFYNLNHLSSWIFAIIIPLFAFISTIKSDYKEYKVAMQYKKELNIINNLFRIMSFDEQKSLNFINQFHDFKSTLKQNFKIISNDYPFIENTKIKFCLRCGKRNSISYIHRTEYKQEIWFSRCLNCKKI